MFYDTITSHDNLCYSCRVVTASEHCNVYALDNPHAENDHIVLLIQSKSFVKEIRPLMLCSYLIRLTVLLELLRRTKLTLV